MADDKGALVADDGNAIEEEPVMSPAISSTASDHKEDSPLHFRDAGSKPTASSERGLLLVVLASVGIAVVITIALIISIYYGPPQVPPHGGVSSPVKQCSEMGVDVLKKGGSAVDAAITTTLCCGVIKMQSSGIGGGGFMVLHDHKKHHSSFINFRETAPAKSAPDMFAASPKSQIRGAMSVAVPGEIRGMEEAHKQHGKLKWKELFEPVIELAQDFPVHITTAELLRSTNHPYFKKSALSAKLDQLLLPNNRAVTEGERLSRLGLVDTLKKIAEDGPGAFYSGQIAQGIVDTVTAGGGVLTLDDLKNYQVVKSDVLCIDVFGHTVLTGPAPSGGPVVGLVLKVLDKMNSTSGDVDKPLFWHRLTEALKHGYARHGLLLDPHAVPEAANASNVMISDATAADVASKISDSQTFPSSHYAATPPAQGAGTTHISVVDNKDLWVSVTISLNFAFGSGLMTPGGIILNNHMADFDPPRPGPVPKTALHNLPAAGKRPISSMSPVVTHDTDKACGLRAAVGAINGTRIISGVAETLVRLLLAGQSVTEAVAAPRLHPNLENDTLEYEEKFPSAVINELTKLGHNVQKVGEYINAVNAVAKDEQTISTAADSRNHAGAADY